MSANTAITEATAALEAYRFDEYAAAGYRFVWNTFCDWFLEFSKPLLAEGADPADTAEIRGVGAHVLGLILRLLHPAIPFVTEELWDHFGYGEAIQPDRHRLAGACPGPRRGGSPSGTGLGGAADRPGPFGAHRDERAAVEAVAGAAARRVGGDAGPGRSLDGRDPAAGTRLARCCR